jgi:hypothetical protein
LDYKRCASLANTEGKKNDVSKDVSAFANSAGGTIVYGIVEEAHKPIRIDEGYDPATVSREWLEQIIGSNIQRRVDGVLIKPVNLATTHADRVAYVVFVPQSLRAPHQAADKRFYKRFNFQSVPMEEYEIRDCARRLEGPLLSLSFAAEVAEGPPRCVRIIPIIANESPTPAEYVVVRIYVDDRLEVTGPGGMKEVGSCEVGIGSVRASCRAFHTNHGIPGKIPIFEGCPFRLLDNPIDVTEPEADSYVIGWELLSPRMAPKRGGGLLVHAGQTWTVLQVPEAS